MVNYNSGVNKDTLHGCVRLVVEEAVNHCKSRPPSNWPATAYTLIGRQDLGQAVDDQMTPVQSDMTTTAVLKALRDDTDGMECLDQEVNRVT